MKKKIIILTVVLAVFALGSEPAYAKKGFLEALLPGIFGKKDNGPKPEDTLIAPFAYEDPSLSEETKTKEGLPLNVAHRGNREIGEWLMQAVSEGMTFESGNFQEELKGTTSYFDEPGHKEYLAFLQESGIIKVLESEKYHIRSFVQHAPLLLNEGSVENRYRWLYETTLMASYMDREMENYKKQVTPVNQMVRVTIQVGRSKDADNEHKILIESWSGKIQKLDKK
ncbi:MAG: hypothetical protein DHS20C02_19500 [Micavibrio sp.]|nr:MAG: hypothetical protein DHS20C02_19500 [Micavibrio sp.]